MATDIVYNGVTMSNVRTKRFDQVNVYDDSHTDLLYSKFTIIAQGYIHKVRDPVTGVDITPGSTKSVTIGHSLIRAMLMEPRKSFSMKVGGNLLLDCSPGYDPITPTPAGQTRGSSPRQTAGVDLNNGPKPLSCNITQIVGSEVLIVEFEIELCMLMCNQLSNSTGVLSNRWSMHDTIDENWYTTRVIQGRIRVVNPYLKVADFRGLVVPDLQPGYRRQSIDCVVSTDGLMMDYTIVDRQFFVACPSPARTWAVTHEATTADGFNHIESVNIMLETDPLQRNSKYALLALAMEIADSRLHFSRFKPGDENGNILENMSIINYVDTGRIEVRVSCMSRPTDLKFMYNNQIIRLDPLYFFAHLMAPFDLDDAKIRLNVKRPAYDPDVQQAIPMYGTTTTFGMFICYLQSPCNYLHQVPQAGVESKPEPTKKGKGKDTKVNVTQGSLKDLDEDVKKNFKNNANRYSHYEVETKYEYKQNLVALPIARSTSSSTSGAASQTFIRMAPKTCYRKVLVTAQRYGKPPELPSPDSFSVGNAKAMAIGDMVVTSKAPTYAADQTTRIYDLQCEYTFAMSHFPRAQDPIVIGALPYDANSSKASQLTTGLIFNDSLIGNVQTIS